MNPGLDKDDADNGADVVRWALIDAKKQSMLEKVLTMCVAVGAAIPDMQEPYGKCCDVVSFVVFSTLSPSRL